MLTTGMRCTGKLATGFDMHDGHGNRVPTSQIMLWLSMGSDVWSVMNVMLRLKEICPLSKLVEHCIRRIYCAHSIVFGVQRADW